MTDHFVDDQPGSSGHKDLTNLPKTDYSPVVPRPPVNFDEAMQRNVVQFEKELHAATHKLVDLLNTVADGYPPSVTQRATQDAEEALRDFMPLLSEEDTQTLFKLRTKNVDRSQLHGPSTQPRYSEKLSKIELEREGFADDFQKLIEGAAEPAREEVKQAFAAFAERTTALVEQYSDTERLYKITPLLERGAPFLDTETQNRLYALLPAPIIPGDGADNKLSLGTPEFNGDSKRRANPEVQLFDHFLSGDGANLVRGSFSESDRLRALRILSAHTPTTEEKAGVAESFVPDIAEKVVTQIQRGNIETAREWEKLLPERFQLLQRSAKTIYEDAQPDGSSIPDAVVAPTTDNAVEQYKQTIRDARMSPLAILRRVREEHSDRPHLDALETFKALLDAKVITLDEAQRTAAQFASQNQPAMLTWLKDRDLAGHLLDVGNQPSAIAKEA